MFVQRVSETSMPEPYRRLTPIHLFTGLRPDYTERWYQHKMHGTRHQTCSSLRQFQTPRASRVTIREQTNSFSISIGKLP